MNTQQRRFFTWIPGILAVAYIGFLALFALDVFSEYDNWQETFIALFMHLIPNFILLIALAIAWRWKLIGGFLFLVLAVISMIFFNTYEHIISFSIVSLPIFVIGVLFIVDSFLDAFQPDFSKP